LPPISPPPLLKRHSPFEQQSPQQGFQPTTEVLVSITSTPGKENKSFEELRLESSKQH
jgi:hypothetical protein